MTTILGQERALDILRSALRAGRFHHAWIFSGPRGVGKFTIAIETARVLLDPELTAGSEKRASSKSESSGLLPGRHSSRTQHLIDAGTHPDLHVIRKEDALYSSSRALREHKQTNIPLDLLRERLIGGVSGEVYHDAVAYRKAALGHGKVFIIDEAELLDATSQNALLKTLEEPPPETYLFLITSHPDDLLPTIRSRCQHVRFVPLDDRAMELWMKDHGQAAKAAHVEWIESFAEGSPGAARLAIDYGLYEWWKRLEPMLKELERGRYPVTMGETLHALVQEFAEAWVKGHKNASKDAANKDGARHVFTLLGSFARRRMAESIATGGTGGPDWPAMIDLLHEAERNLDFNVNLRMLMENLAAQWGRCCSESAPARR